MIKHFTVVAAAAVLVAGATDSEAQIEPQSRLNPLVIENGEPIALHRVAGGLERPWSLAFLPDGRLLVSELVGNLRIVDHDGTVSEPIEGTPAVFAQGQGGLLDIALDPEFEQNGTIFLSYAAPGPDGSAATAVGRGHFDGQRITDWEELFRQEPWITGPNHFGGRIDIAPDGTLYVALGERFQFDPAQDLGVHLGKIVRINRDGSIPADNPFVGDEAANDAIWSYGHRNVEAAAFDPATGHYWVAEMGPLGGDELNRPEAGANYGWPTVSWGMNYDGTDIPDPQTRPEFASATWVWSPVLSPSGMIFYGGDSFPGWQGDMFIGSLTQHGLAHVDVNGETIRFIRVIPLETRVRDVVEGPDGNIYYSADREGEIRRMSPLR